MCRRSILPSSGGNVDASGHRNPVAHLSFLTITHDGDYPVLKSLWKKMVRGLLRGSRVARPIRSSRRSLSFELLEDRIAPAVTAFFTPQSGILTVLGDSLHNTITISRNLAGNILVNGGAVNVLGGTATVANTAQIQIFGQGGNDTLALNEAVGALPAASIFGGAGD